MSSLLDRCPPDQISQSCGLQVHAGEAEDERTERMYPVYLSQ